ncbi:MAG: SCP2 sterol-binding domain-containing protein [Micropepsaceae bacterium]
MSPTTSAPRISFTPRLGRFGEQALTAIPLAILNPALNLIAGHLARLRPDLFKRMGVHARKRFLINPMDSPFVFSMVPDTASPRLTAFSRHAYPAHDGAISGPFLDLLDMIEGAQDGDALFFNRNLQVSGDIEAVVALRNALDDFDGDLVREILNALGPLSGLGGLAIKLLRSLRGARHANG